MAGKISIQLPNPEGVAAGGRATFRIPMGRRIHNLQFLFNKDNQTMADFTEFRIYINGSVFQSFSGVSRDVINVSEKCEAAQTSGILEIAFDRRKLLTLAGREATALNTNVADAMGNSIQSMYMEVDIAAGATITAADLALYSKQSDAILTDVNGVKYGAGIIPYMRVVQRTISGATADWQISDLVNPGINATDKLALSRVTFKPSAGTLTKIKIDRNNYNIFDRTDSLNRKILNDGGVRAAVAGYYAVDTGENGEGGDVIDLVGISDFKYRLDASAAMTLTIISEYFGALQP
jgi:hypothetical protein